MNSSLNGVAGDGGVGSQAGCLNSFGSLLYNLLKNDSALLALKLGRRQPYLQHQNDFAQDLQALRASNLPSFLGLDRTLYCGSSGDGGNL